VQFANFPRILEELLRNLLDSGGFMQGEGFDLLEIAPHITYIHDAILLVYKIHATVGNESLSPCSSWLPSFSFNNKKTSNSSVT